MGSTTRVARRPPDGKATFLLLLIVALAWRRPWLGGLACLALAAWYVSWAAPRFPWTVLLTMAGPLLLVSGLYAWSWASHRRLRQS